MLKLFCVLSVLSSQGVLTFADRNISRTRIIIFPRTEDGDTPSRQEQGIETKLLKDEDEFQGVTGLFEKVILYSDWSEWSQCSINCEQTRKRRCRTPKTCGNAVIKETRPCPTQHNRRHKRKCHRKQNRHKHKHKDFNVVRFFNHPELKSSFGRGVLSTGQWRSDRGSWSRLSLVEAGSRPQKTQDNRLYGKWGPWADCSKSCTTRRYRWCKRRDVCGDQIHKEAAYCYVEGSFCQRWIQRKIQQNEENEADINFHIESYRGRRGRGKVTQNKTTTTTTTTTTTPAPVPTHAQQEHECGVVDNTNTRSRWLMTRIIGGRPTLKGRWPWQVAVLNRYKEAFCGGTLVAPQWVLTAAHCIRKRLYVRIGEHDLSQVEGTEIELRVSQMISHPSYDPETVDNDVALLRLPLVVKPDRYRGLACLPKPRQPPPVSQYCTIIGWGKRKSSDFFGTDVLHEAQVPIVSNEVCRSVYEDYHITNNMFCAGYRRGRMDSCAGDSGGPLLCKMGNKWTIFGITSFGEGCGKRGKYGIYTRLSNYVKWIQKTIRGKTRQ